MGWKYTVYGYCWDCGSYVYDINDWKCKSCRERKNKMINIDGVELSEDTVRNALKKAGISLEKKHKFKPGDICLRAGMFHNGDFRLLIRLGNDLYSINNFGKNARWLKEVVSQKYLEKGEYKYIGRFEDMVKEYMNNHPELKG